MRQRVLACGSGFRYRCYRTSWPDTNHKLNFVATAILRSDEYATLSTALIDLGQIKHDGAIAIQSAFNINAGEDRRAGGIILMDNYSVVTVNHRLYVADMVDIVDLAPHRVRAVTTSADLAPYPA